MLKKSSEPSFWEVMDSFVLVAYPSLAASRTLLQWLLACLNFTLDSAGTNKKQKISGSSKSCWTSWRWVRFDLILTMRDMYINSNLNPLTKFTSSSRSTEFKDILPWNISQMITKTIPISTRIVINYAMKGASHWQFDGKSMETETTTWSEFPNGGQAIVEQTLASEERNNPKEQDCQSYCQRCQ